MNYPQPYLEFVAHFNRGEYRACGEPLEQIWFAQRDDFHKGLIRLVVGLLQIELGLDSGPRFLLATARDLIQPYHPRHQGINLTALEAFIAEQQARLDLPASERSAQRFRIDLDPAAEAVSESRSEGERCTGLLS